MSIMPQETEQDVIERLRLWNAMREPATLVKLSSVREVLGDALTVMDRMSARNKELLETLRDSLPSILIASEYLREAGKSEAANAALALERKARAAIANGSPPAHNAGQPS